MLRMNAENTGFLRSNIIDRMNRFLIEEICDQS
jgi:hypothetical protein